VRRLLLLRGGLGRFGELRLGEIVAIAALGASRLVELRIDLGAEERNARGALPCRRIKFVAAGRILVGVTAQLLAG
jgi:hypothetical protein